MFVYNLCERYTYLDEYFTLQYLHVFISQRHLEKKMNA